MPQDVYALLAQACDTLRATDRLGHAIASDWRSIQHAQHPLRSQVAESSSKRHNGAWIDGTVAVKVCEETHPGIRESIAAARTRNAATRAQAKAIINPPA